MHIKVSEFKDGDPVRIHEHPPSDVFQDGTVWMDGPYLRLVLNDGTVIDPGDRQMHHVPAGPGGRCAQCPEEAGG